MTAHEQGAAKRIRVGIIGANPDRGWAAEGHIPALKSLPDDFEITALSTSRRQSTDAASERFGVPLAFDKTQDLVNSADVDVVAITVKVPYHFELASAALAAGKAVYCEWPLGNGLKEATQLAALAKKKGVLAVAGLQARSAALGHAADALCYCLSEVRELSATMTMRRKSFTIADTGERKPMNADDQVCVDGLLEGGAAFSIHYRGGRSRVSPATIARARISAPHSTTRSRAIACWTRSRRPRLPVSVKRPVDPAR
jgi:hypothetical protein